MGSHDRTKVVKLSESQKALEGVGEGTLLVFIINMVKMGWLHWLTLSVLLLSFSAVCKAEEAEEGELETETVDADLGSSREGSRTDSEVVDREEEAIKLDGMSVAEMKLMRE